jgi:hypothetical protein
MTFLDLLSGIKGKNPYQFSKFVMECNLKANSQKEMGWEL